MLGTQEKESDKESMCECGIWRELRGVVSSGHENVFYGERKV